MFDDLESNTNLNVSFGDYERDERDVKFLNDAAEMNMKEIYLGELARKKSSTSDAKELAEMMVEEHTKSLSDLNVLTTERSIALPNGQSDDAINKHHKLSNKSGLEFDEAYTKLMVEEHEHALELFEHAAADCSDPAIRTWASSSIITLQKHLDHSKHCYEKVKKNKDLTSR